MQEASSVRMSEVPSQGIRVTCVSLCVPRSVSLLSDTKCAPVCPSCSSSSCLPLCFPMTHMDMMAATFLSLCSCCSPATDSWRRENMIKGFNEATLMLSGQGEKVIAGKWRCKMQSPITSRETDTLSGQEGITWWGKWREPQKKVLGKGLQVWGGKVMVGEMPTKRFDYHPLIPYSIVCPVFTRSCFGYTSAKDVDGR